MIKLAFIFVGSGVGGVLRWLIVSAVQGKSPSSFPLATLLVNVSGCVAIGFLAVALGGPMVREEHRAALLVGLLGGYTTYSAFGRETLALLQNGQWPAALLNIALSNLLGLAGVWAGWAIAVRMYGAQSA